MIIRRNEPWFWPAFVVCGQRLCGASTGTVCLSACDSDLRMTYGDQPKFQTLHSTLLVKNENARESFLRDEN
jgi:hypothetical protein